jgi:DNA-directed RNA polymerase alpha subunit
MYAELGEAKKRIGEVHQAVDLLLAAPLLRILSEPITSLSLSVRAYNVLAKGGLTTLGHVAACSYEDLRAYRNCGETTAKEIQTAMNQVGIPMGFNVELMRKRFPNII